MLSGFDPDAVRTLSATLTATHFFEQCCMAHSITIESGTAVSLLQLMPHDSQGCAAAQRARAGSESAREVPPALALNQQRRQELATRFSVATSVGHSVSPRTPPHFAFSPRMLCGVAAIRDNIQDIRLWSYIAALLLWQRRTAEPAASYFSIASYGQNLNGA